MSVLSHASLVALEVGRSLEALTELAILTDLSRANAAASHALLSVAGVVFGAFCASFDGDRAPLFVLRTLAGHTCGSWLLVLHQVLHRILGPLPHDVVHA